MKAFQALKKAFDVVLCGVDVDDKNTAKVFSSQNKMLIDFYRLNAQIKNVRVQSISKRNISTIS